MYSAALNWWTFETKMDWHSRQNDSHDQTPEPPSPSHFTLLVITRKYFYSFGSMETPHSNHMTFLSPSTLWRTTIFTAFQKQSVIGWKHIYVVIISRPLSWRDFAIKHITLNISLTKKLWSYSLSTVPSTDWYHQNLLHGAMERMEYCRSRLNKRPHQGSLRKNPYNG